MTVTLKRADPEDFPKEALTWTTIEGTILMCAKMPETPDGFPVLGNLNNHEIAADGTVTPSVLITHNYGPEMSQQWHEFVKLEDWSP
jgi:hypothetical protein